MLCDLKRRTSVINSNFIAMPVRSHDASLLFRDFRSSTARPYHALGSPVLSAYAGPCQLGFSVRRTRRLRRRSAPRLPRHPKLPIFAAMSCEVAVVKRRLPAGRPRISCLHRRSDIRKGRRQSTRMNANRRPFAWIGVRWRYFVMAH